MKERSIYTKIDRARKHNVRVVSVGSISEVEVVRKLNRRSCEFQKGKVAQRLPQSL
jgi:hypothetical protein